MRRGRARGHGGDRPCGVAPARARAQRAHARGRRPVRAKLRLCEHLRVRAARRRFREGAGARPARPRNGTRKMKTWALDYLACPVTGARLELTDASMDGDEIVRGTLVSPQGRRYPIVNGVPRFAQIEGLDTQSAESVESFG